MTNIKKPVKEQKEIVNEQIPSNVQLLLIDNDGNKLGTFDKKHALEEAYKRDLDLVVVSQSPKLWVAKLMDYSKYRYDQQKKAKEIKKNQVVVKIQEIRLSPTIDVHDFNTKLNNAQKIIDKNNKVKITIKFKGRMITHVEIGEEVMNKFIEQVNNIIVEQKPKMEGKQMTAVIAPMPQK